MRDLADLAWRAGELVASEPTPQCRLLRLLVARAFRRAAWQRFVSAMRFDPPLCDDWRLLSAIHLDKAIDLEWLARATELGVHPWELHRPARHSIEEGGANGTVVS